MFLLEPPVTVADYRKRLDARDPYLTNQVYPPTPNDPYGRRLTKGSLLNPSPSLPKTNWPENDLARRLEKAMEENLRRDIAMSKMLLEQMTELRESIYGCKI
jgi:hypothetical protein